MNRQFKQKIILEKARATQVGNKFLFKFPRGIRFNKWRVKKIYIPGLDEIANLQTQITSNDTDITALQTEQTTQNTNITSNDSDILAIQTVMSTDTERLNAVTALTTSYTSADTTLNGLLTTAINTKLNTSSFDSFFDDTNGNGTLDIFGLNNETNVIYVDAGITESTEDGSKMYPYHNLSNALTAKLTDGSNTTYIFKLSPGEYVGTFSLDKTTANQSFSIIGSGIDRTFIKGSSAWSGSTGDILKLTDFLDITVKDCTFQYGRYAFYPKNCRKIILSKVKFINNGSVGTVNRHIASSKTDQATYWASSNTSDGGATRIQGCEEVCIYNCEASYNARGFRIQDCGTTGKNSIVTGCKAYRNLEGNYYLASGSYFGNLGCENFMVSNNTSEEGYNNGILCIGGRNNTIQNNNIIKSANAGVMMWHTLDCTIKDNNIYNCNLLTYNGVGNDGDSFGSIVVDGNTNIGSGDFMAIIENNCMRNCNQGRAASKIGINIMPVENTGNGGYPTASNKVTINNNTSDATNRIVNVEPITVLEVSDSAGIGTDLLIENTNGNSSITIKSRGDMLTNTEPKASLIFELDDNSAGNEDQIFSIESNPADHHNLEFRSTWNSAIKRYITMFRDGGIGFNECGNTVGRSACFQKTVLFRGVVDFEEDINLSINNKAVNCGTGLVTCGSLALNGVTHTSIPKTVLAVRTTQNSTIITITNETIIIAGNPQSSGTQNPQITYYLPQGSYNWNGRKIEFLGDNYGSGNACLQLECVPNQTPQDTISAGSVGTLSNLIGSIGNQGFRVTRLKIHHGHYTAVFNSNTNRWTLTGTPTAGC